MDEFEDDYRSAADPLAACNEAKNQDLILRVFIGFCLAAILWHEVSDLASALAFVYVYFFLPRLTSPALTLKSGRTVAAVRPTVTKYWYGKKAGKKVLDVIYTCCSQDVDALEIQKEFDEMCQAVFTACDQRKLLAAEVTAELPRKSSLVGIHLLATVARSAEFEKVGRIWQEVEPL